MQKRILCVGMIQQICKSSRQPLVLQFDFAVQLCVEIKRTGGIILEVKGTLLFLSVVTSFEIPFLLSMAGLLIFVIQMQFKLKRKDLSRTSKSVEVHVGSRNNPPRVFSRAESPMDISNYMTYCWGLLSGNTGYKLVESKQDKLKITCAIFELKF